MSAAELVDQLLFVTADARHVVALHPWALPGLFVVVFAIGWSTPYAWDAVKRHRLGAVQVGGLALGALVLAALAPTIATSSVASPACAFAQVCGSDQQAHEKCSQRYDDWQKWQRCVERRTRG